MKQLATKTAFVMRRRSIVL